MRREWLQAALIIAAAVCPPLAQAAPRLQLIRVVVLLRHGVRSPTHEPALSPAIAPDAWPGWEVPDGFLTPHGAAAITLLAGFDRRLLAAGGGCPDLAIEADVDERTVATGEAFAAGFAPGCGIIVTHSTTPADPLFSPLEKGAPDFDAKRARADMLRAAGGDLTDPVRANAALFRRMQAVLDPRGDGFLAQPAGLAGGSGRLPKLSGPIAQGASGAEDFLLEYLDGKPLSQVAWGRADGEDVAELLALHALAYRLTARPAGIAQATAAPLARRILQGLKGGARVQILVGHDTNIAELAGLLRLHWALGGYPADDPPPGGGLIFSLLRGADGARYVTAAFQVQTMAQIRNLTPLSAGNPPAMLPLPIPGCGDSTARTACPLTVFARLIPGGG